VTRRVVRVTPEVFILLDEQLPSERGSAGEPTAAEFAASDLVAIVEEFAARDDLPMSIRRRADYRVLITTTHLVPYVAVRGQLSPVDGAIELIDIDIDLHGLDPAPDDNCAASGPCPDLQQPGAVIVRTCLSGLARARHRSRWSASAG
jgi:hypothetical protein